MSSEDRDPPSPEHTGARRGPWDRAPPEPARPAPTPPAVRRSWAAYGSAAIFVLLLLSVGIRAYRDLSGPDTWAYWKDLYVAPGLASATTTSAAFGAGTRQVLAVTGTIGAAGASWLRDRLDQARLRPGDVVLLSSPGGDLDQSMIMGEMVRARGLATAVGSVDPAGTIGASYCASACVFVYAGGTNRIGIDGSRLGVHRFVASRTVPDPVADTQRTAGQILNYLTRMGIAPAMFETMSATDRIRWLEPGEALNMKLVTETIRRP